MLPALFLLFFFILFLAFPSVIAAGATEGLVAWYRNVLPVLFPYMVFTGLMIKSKAARKIAVLFHPLLGRLFSLSISGTYALLCGLLCGYPMGAAITARLREEGSVSRNEASYLLTFVNMPGPSFLTGYLLHTCYPDGPLPLWCLFAVLYLCAFLISLITRRLCQISAGSGEPEPDAQQKISLPQALDDGISEALTTQLKICGCMVFYSALTALFLQALWHLHGLLPESVLYVLGGIPEITSGIRRLSSWSQGPFSFSAACGLCAFGGISVTAQTYTVTNNTKTRQPLGGYLVCKILYGILVFGSLYGICLLR